ncbi:MAG: hypothetical protein ACMXYB_01055 [Candidatus Woesearchaeota archaeon]
MEYQKNEEIYEDLSNFKSNIIVITSDKHASIDTLCSCEAYCYFLTQKGFEAYHIQEKILSQMEEKMFEFCKLTPPMYSSISEFLSPEQITKVEFICINISSFKELHPTITPQNIQGVMGNKKPDYFDYFEEKISHKHIEFSNSFSTLVAEKFRYTQTSITPQVASLLLIGIILSLNGLEESQTTNRDFVAIEYLEQFSNVSKENINTLVNQL